MRRSVGSAVGCVCAKAYLLPWGSAEGRYIQLCWVHAGCPPAHPPRACAHSRCAMSLFVFPPAPIAGMPTSVTCTTSEIW